MGYAEAFAVAAVIAITAMYIKNLYHDAHFVRSGVDGKEYLVLKLRDSQRAADTLAGMNANLRKLLAAIERDLPAEGEPDPGDDSDDDGGSDGGGSDGGDGEGEGRRVRADKRKVLENVRKRYRRSALSEGGRDVTVTSYSQGKGERIVMCLRERDKLGRLGEIQDDNTLMYVFLHEIAHLATDELGHVPRFWSNFRFLLDAAEKEGIYRKVDYASSPQGYCGIEISSSAAFPKNGSHGTG